MGASPAPPLREDTALPLACKGQERWPWEPRLLADDTAQVSEMLWMPGCGGPTEFKSLESLLSAL